MNFTQEIKHDLIRSVPKERDCLGAVFAALLDTGGDVRLTENERRGTLSFVIESEEIASYLLNIFEELFPGESLSLSRIELDPKRGKSKLTVSYTGESAADIVRAAYAFGEGEETARSYLCGAFLGSGSCTLPKDGTKTGYHLEVIFNGDGPSRMFGESLAFFQILANAVKRGDKQVFYLKSREAISDFLSVIGANRALRTLERISAEREENNNENRIVNCMAGNADRAATASVAQTVTFGRLKQAGIAQELPPQLLSVLEGRLACPTLSLAELAKQLNISKSCLNHRIRKLMRISEEKGLS